MLIVLSLLLLIGLNIIPLYRTLVSVSSFTCTYVMLQFSMWKDPIVIPSSSWYLITVLNVATYLGPSAWLVVSLPVFFSELCRLTTWMYRSQHLHSPSSLFVMLSNKYVVVVWLSPNCCYMYIHILYSLAWKCVKWSLTMSSSSLLPRSEVIVRYPCLERLWLDDNQLCDCSTFSTLAGLKRYNITTISPTALLHW